MEQVTKEQLVELGKLSPPFSPVTEGEILHLATGVVALLEHGPEILSVLDDENPLRAAGIAAIGDQEVTGPITGATDEAPPVPLATGPVAPAPTAVEPNTEPSPPDGEIPPDPPAESGK